MQLNSPNSHTGVNLFKTAAVILAAIGAYLLWGDVISETIGIFFGACVFAFLLSPVSKLLEKKLKRPIAATISVISAAALLPILSAILLPSLIRQFSTIAETLPEAFERIRILSERFGALIAKHLPEISFSSSGISGMESSLAQLPKQAMIAVSSLASSIYRLFLMAALSCFLISDRQRILLRLELLIPSTWRKMAIRAGSTLLRELRLYLRGQATIALAVGLLAASGLGLLGLSSAPVLGAIVGIFNVIPYFGPLLGGIPAVIMALGEGWQMAAMVVLLLFLVQQIDGMVISPRVMGNITGFSPAVVLLALFAGARIGSIGGMLLALPALLSIRTLYRVFVQRYEKN